MNDIVRLLKPNPEPSLSATFLWGRQPMKQERVLIMSLGQNKSVSGEGGRIAVLGRKVRSGLSGKVAFELRPEGAEKGSHEDGWGQGKRK